MAIATVLLLQANRFYADMLRQQIAAVYPGAVCKWVSRVAEAQRAVLSGPVDLLVAGTEAVDGDVLDFLLACTGVEPPARFILVITSHREPHLLERLRSMPVSGVFDSADESAENVTHALRAVSEGETYWSSSLDAIRAQSRTVQHRLRLLTPTERMVFAVIGDGSDDETAATWLGMKASAVQTVRRKLHEKLEIQQKGELVRAATQYGFVRFTPHGVVRVGFGSLLVDYQVHSKRPLSLPTRLAEEYPLAAAAAEARRRSTKRVSLSP
jgi:DNA-binding NarL/FixJ family response regulator